MYAFPLSLFLPSSQLNVSGLFVHLSAITLSGNFGFCTLTYAHAGLQR